MILSSDSFGLGTIENGEESLELSVMGYRQYGQNDIRYDFFPVQVSDLEKVSSFCKIKTQYFAIFSDIFMPFRFGFIIYDPFESILESINRNLEMSSHKINNSSDNESIQNLSSYIWAAIESDLFRFLMDEELKQSLETQHGNSEWKRFAELNNFYRMIIKAIVPSGIIPKSWKNILLHKYKANSKFDIFTEHLFSRKLNYTVEYILERTKDKDCYCFD